MNNGHSLYLDLMKRCLTNWIYGDQEVRPVVNIRFSDQRLADSFKAQKLRVMQEQPMDPQKRANGIDWPPTAHTMVGLKRLDNLQFCIEDVLARNVPGDLIETGVWRGGASIFMRAVLKAHRVEDRTVWVADSFQGLPKPDVEKYPQDKGDNLHSFKELAISLDTVKANFQRYDLLDDQVRFLEGWFKDTLPQAPVEKLAVARLDGDMYESTMDGLNNLYAKLSPGGYLIMDDYGAIPACKQAVHDYREAHGINDEIVPVDWTCVYWRRSG